MTRGFLAAIAAMTAVVTASNVLVQFPVEARLGPIDLADLLTWGAFTYPFAFLVGDLTNRNLGPAAARRVAYAGFTVAVLLSAWASTPRIAFASGAAFLTAQLLDIAIFHRLRRHQWWRPPLVSTLIGSTADTFLFFTLAFAPALLFLGAGDPFAAEAAPLLGAFAPEAPRFVSWALGDLGVKLSLAALTLAPYRALIGLMPPPRGSEA